MSGSFTTLTDDLCKINLRVQDSVGPFEYNTNRIKFVNCNKSEPVQRVTIPLVDVESELKNITRFNSKCDIFKYNPGCKFNPNGKNNCISTYSSFIPKNAEPTISPDYEKYVYFNNGLIRPANPLRWPNPNICS